MAKAVFRPGELTVVKEKVVINAPTSFAELAHLVPAEEEVVEALDEVEEYTGPTADDLRREAEAYKVQWEEEKEAMLRAARSQAESIIKEAEAAAFQEVKRKTDEAQSLKRQAQDEADQLVADARASASQIESEMRETLDEQIKDAIDKGREEGKEQGYAEGKAEVDRLIQRTQVVLERAQDKRAEIITGAEQEIIDLILLISRKVIKVISDNQRNVIISNVVQALRKVKAKGNIIIHVNIADVKLATEHIKDFIQLIEGAKSIQVVEDSTVDSGGCVIETDFGEIDARISSQLSELEDKILAVSPIRSKLKSEMTAPVLSEEAADLP